MRHKAPKKNTDKETIRELRGQVARLEKELRLTKEEIKNLQKPIRKRKEVKHRTEEEIRQDFIKKLKSEVNGKK